MPAQPNRLLTARREDRAGRLRLRGWGVERIADQLAADGLGRVTHQAVSAMLARVERRVRAETVDRAKEERARQLILLNHAEAEALNAWHLSKEPVRRVAEKEIDPQAGARQTGRTERTVALEERCGEVAYLYAVMAAGDRKRKMLGLDAPTRIKHGGDAAAPPIAVEHTGSVVLTGLDDDELEQLIALTDKAAAAAAVPATNGDHDGD